MSDLITGTPCATPVTQGKYQALPPNFHVNMDTEPSSSRSSLVPSSPDRRYHTQRTSPARAASVPSTTTSRRSIPRSCYNCNRKKIRCDKTDPCSACTRAGKSCTFPPQGPRIRRAKKTIMADMASRIADLEGALSKATNTARLTPEVETTRSRQKSPERPDSGSYPGPLTERAREDIIVQKGSSTHYINEILLSRVITAVRYTFFFFLPSRDLFILAILTKNRNKIWGLF